MNSHLFSADMKLADVIHADYSLLLLLHRFGINLGFGDKTVRECCEANHVSCTLFLMICNVYSNEQYLPTEKEIEGIGANVDQLIAYLKNSHSYYLENRMLSIQEQLKEISEGCEQQHQQIFKIIILLPFTTSQACLNFTNCTAYSFHYSGNTGNIFTTGVRLARSMALLRIVSGAAGVLHLDILIRKTCLIWCGNTASRPG